MQHLGATTHTSSRVTSSSSSLSTFFLSRSRTSRAAAFCSSFLIFPWWKASMLCLSRSLYSMNSINSCFICWRFSTRALTSLDVSYRRSGHVINSRGFFFFWVVKKYNVYFVVSPGLVTPCACTRGKGIVCLSSSAEKLPGLEIQAFCHMLMSWL